MDRFPSRDKGSYLDWRPGTVNVRWDRVVTKVDGNTITLDAPLTTALDAAHGRCSVRHVHVAGPGRGRSASRTCAASPRSTRTTRATRTTPGPASPSRTPRTSGCGR